MKVFALCVLLFAAVARAQNLQYEQAAYTDAAAPAPVDAPMSQQQAPDAFNADDSEGELVDADESDEDEAEGESDSEESSFSEWDSSTASGYNFGRPRPPPRGGPLTRAAKRTRRNTKHVKDLFAKRRSQGGNISPSRKVVPPPKHNRRRRTAGKSAAPAKTVSAQRVSAMAPSIVKLTTTKPGKGSKPTPARRRPIVDPSMRPRNRPKPGFAPRPRPSRPSSGGSRPRPRPSKPVRRPISVPRPPKAAAGPVDELWHSERWTPKGSENRDPEMAKLNLALEAVKENILLTNKQINDERRWVIAVGKIIASYNTKMKRVEGHIIALRKEMKALYRKKKQIENLKLQKALEAKLREAKAELATLTNSLKHVAVKQGELNKSGKDLRMTIAGIQGQLAKLRGQQMFKRCKAGTKYSKKAKKCVSICKPSAVYSKKSKKCVARCKKGLKWNGKTRKCIRKKGKGKGKGKGKKGK